MDFFFFHLMPYGALDLDYDKEYVSANLVLPNSYYDPEEGHKLYHRYMDELEYADELGFDGVCVNEHHQTAYGLMPTPGVIAGALARNTKHAKICVLGRALPLVNNPLVVAEEFAMEAAKGGDSDLIWRARYGRGRAALAAGDTDSALAHLEAADAALRATARHSAISSARAPFFWQRRALVDTLAQLLIETHRVEEALEELQDHGRIVDVGGDVEEVGELPPAEF